MKPAIARCLRRAKKHPLPVRWCTGELIIPVPDEPTEFEQKVRRLGLAGKPLSDLFVSTALRNWAEDHRTKHYVPEVLLRLWGMELYERDVNLAAA